MIIGACGYGATGSSVITDLLREYDNVQVYDTFESWISYRVDGLEDLEYHLMKQYSKGESCDAAIRRFLRVSQSYMVPFIHKPCSGNHFYKLSKQFIDEITQFKFKGMYTADISSGCVYRDFFAFALKKVIIPKILEKITRKRLYVWPADHKYFSVEPDNFYSAARRYTDGILEAMGADLKIPICLDQPFSGNNPEASFPFYNNPYAIVVDKDPRDLYLAGKYTKDPNFKFSPVYDVEKFVKYYRCLRLKKRTNKRVLYMRFEDLIYRYDESIKIIEKFLNLGEHIRKKQFFIPEKSINNTQLIRLHPQDKKEIDYIEKELTDFLYPFQDFKDVVFNGRPFDGAGRKVFEQ